MSESTIRVLLVDDDEEDYTLVNRYLKKARTGPFDVQWVPGFEEALAAIETRSHDVCLLDYRLGERTGLDLLREVQALGGDIPVILLTGRGSFELDIEAMELGAFDYLEKADITPALLERSIRYTIENHSARAALRKANEELELRVRERTAELHRSNRDLEEFANVVARDLRACLQGITRQIEQMKLPEPGGENADLRYRLLDPVLHAAKNMELLVQSVLDYSRVGKETRPFEVVDLSAIVQDVCAELEDMITGAGATVEVEPLPPVRGDGKLLAGLFENLLSNAIKFRGEELPKIRLSADRKGAWWLCAVSDNGIGVEEEDADEIFLMFARGEGKTDYPGIGIGLAMCRKIAQYHGGTIWVDSNPEGGSTFYVTFPAE
jgi:light-regulated signal transduction histidine kinase (bacteriophytochrome)